jgi:hypothetical protein
LGGVRRLVPILAVLLVAAGCGSPGASADDALCINRALTGVLHVDHDDPRAVWATNAATGRNISVRLPGGYGVTEDDLVVDEAGRTIAANGDTIVGGCADLMQDALLITEADIRRTPSN